MSFNNTNIGTLIAGLGEPLLGFKSIAIYLPDFTIGSVVYSIPTYYVESVTLEMNNIDGLGVFTGSGYTNYPQFHKIGDLSVILYEDTNASTLKWIGAWKSLIKDFQSGVYRPPDDYKRTMSFALMDNNNQTVLHFKYLGVWPTTTSGIPMDYGGERIKITQSFMVDDVEIYTTNTEGYLDGLTGTVSDVNNNDINSRTA